nr:DUF1648 domain-containing protein [Kordiimonas gwangyangensis]
MQIKLKAASIMTAATMGAAVLACLALDPATEVPVHWNIHGEVDGTATPLGALLPLAGLQLLMLAVFACLRFIEPRKANLEKSGKAISATATAIIGFMGLLEAALIAQAFGYDVMSSNAILIATGLLLAVVGNYLQVALRLLHGHPHTLDAVQRTGMAQDPPLGEPPLRAGRSRNCNTITGFDFRHGTDTDDGHYHHHGLGAGNILLVVMARREDQ